MRITSTILGLLLPFFLLAQTAFSEKISPELQAQLQVAVDSYHPIFIVLEEQVDVDKWQRQLQNESDNKDALEQQLLLELATLADQTQAPLLTRLRAMKGIAQESTVSLWISNIIQAKAQASAIKAISQWTEVASIALIEQPKRFDVTVEECDPQSPSGVVRDLRTINAHKLWEMGYTGYGTKVLVVDSGTNSEHIALSPNYWGHNVPHREAWTGNERPATCDDHGTLVTGVSVGIDRCANDTIGVAPNARWMASPIDFGECLLSQGALTAIQVFQWAINPDNDTDTTDDRPDVINNSWGNTNASCDRLYENSLTILEALNVAVIWAAGNSGNDGDRSIYGTQNINRTLVNTFTVGNVDGSSLVITDDSSRGPSYCTGANNSLRIKPEVVAPGRNVRTTNADGEYDVVSGTSFSSPHVAGALLLLREAFPEVSAEDLKLALYFSARDLGAEGEDNAYGMGLIDVLAAYNYLVNVGNTPTPPMSSANDVLMVDINTQREIFCRGEVAVEVSFENAGTSPLQSLDIEYFLNGEEANAVNTTWSGNLAKDDLAIYNLVNLENLTPGEHELTITISNPNGQSDVRSLNNVMKHYIQIADLDYVDATISPQYGASVCSNGSVVLQSNTQLTEGQTLVWYDRPNNSPSINLGKLGEGSVFVSDPLTENTTFYADIITSSVVGQSEPTSNSTSSAAELGIEFEVLQPLTLFSVKVFAEESGGSIFKLQDELGNSLGTEIVSLSVGENTVDIGRSLEPGVYSIVLSPSASTKKLRISNEADFPYEIPGIIRLNSSRSASGNTTTLRYFYFYDFEVQTLHACGRTPINVMVNNQTAPSAGFTSSAEVVALGDAVSFMNTGNSSLDQYWDFGDGTQSTTNNPSHTYAATGSYIVTLTVTDGAGCADAAQRIIEVQPTTATEDIVDENEVTIFPNPTSEHVFIQTRRARQITVEMTDLFGRRMRVDSSNANASGMMLNTQHLANGIYYIIIYMDGKKIVKKLVKA